MKKIDKTKKNIGVSELDDSTRKKLFDDFIEAGGEVIKEKDEPAYDKDLRRRYKHQLEQLRKQQNYSELDEKLKIKNEAPKKQKAEKPEGITPEIQPLKYSGKYPGPTHPFFHGLKIRLKLFFLKVTDFSGYYFTNKFLRSFDEDYKSSLISMQITFFNLFKKNLRTGQKIIESLDKMHPVYFELIELLSNVFERSISNQILEHYYNFQDIPQETKDIQGPLTEIFIKLYPLYQYKELVLTGIERALTLQIRIEKQKFTFFSATKKKVKNDFYVIFNKLYPRLLWLMCSYEGRIFTSDADIKNTILIPDEFIPGRRKRNIPNYSNYSFSEDIFENKKEKTQEDNIPEPVIKGLELMQKIDPEKKQEVKLKNNVFKFINKNDRVFKTSLLLDEFDKEYSFILTTNKIKYNNTLKTHEDLDYKTKFANLYNDIGKCKNRLTDYANILSAFEKLKRETPISSTQFIEYSNRLTALEKEKNQAGSDARDYIKIFMEKLCKELKSLIEDIEKSGNIVVNPADIIIFESEIEGDKKLNTKNISEAIKSSYNYASAFNYRLSPAGDLSGDIDSDEKNLNGESGVAEKNNEIAQDQTAKDKNSETSKNILKELDDLL